MPALDGQTAALDALLGQIDDLPTLPDVHVRIAQALADPDCDFSQVAEMLSMDPVLTGRLIQMANSVAFGASSRASSVLEALGRLGAKQTRNLVLTAGVVEVFDADGVNLRDFWALGLASGICARHIARELRADPEAAYLAGLVHRLGDAVLAVHFPDRFARAIAAARSPELDLDRAVCQEFGFSQAELTTAVLERWNFARPIVEAVAHQLDPDEAPNERVLASIVLASDRICHELGFMSFEEANDERSWVADIPPEFTRLLLDTGCGDLESYLGEKKDHLAEVSDLVRSVFSA